MSRGHEFLAAVLNLTYPPPAAGGEQPAAGIGGDRREFAERQEERSFDVRGEAARAHANFWSSEDDEDFQLIVDVDTLALVDDSLAKMSRALVEAEVLDDFAAGEKVRFAVEDDDEPPVAGQPGLDLGLEFTDAEIVSFLDFACNEVQASP
ncbi:hypothetical protein [Nannocystis punicea]|uniref:Uncharacterized protein n=1 Tax=Nannocystis punicea TaxID=2995304 RepID=A0ABY7HC04_9BACT|nr:hypothetical protein [Nannocystis poenicansa]WAS96802.1 hypothetical protein O0S08_11700 [Nannocystis poenicansa]